MPIGVGIEGVAAGKSHALNREGRIYGAIGGQATMSKRYQNRAMDDPRAAEEISRRRAQFDEAVIRFRDELLRYLLRRTRDAEVAADLAQETFSRMLVYRDAPDIGSHALLMYRIAHNLVLERQRARHRHHASQHVPLSFAEPLCADEPSAEELADAQSLEHSLKQALIALPPKRRWASCSVATTDSPIPKWPRPWASP